MPTGITITRGRNVWSKLEDEIKKTLLIEFEYLYLRLPRTNVRVHLERVASAQKMEFGELLSVWTASLGCCLTISKYKLNLALKHPRGFLHTQ